MPAAATHLCEMSVRERMLMPCWMLVCAHCDFPALAVAQTRVFLTPREGSSCAMCNEPVERRI